MRTLSVRRLILMLLAAVLVMPATVAVAESAAVAAPSQTVSLYRLWSPSATDHFYTTSKPEHDYAITNYGYVDEGVAARVFPVRQRHTVQLYRLWNGSSADHFYTTSRSERDYAIAHYGYVDEGVAAWVYRS